MKGRKRHPWEKRAQRRARQKAFFDLAEVATLSPLYWRQFLNELGHRLKHPEYSDLQKAHEKHMEMIKNGI